MHDKLTTIILMPIYQHRCLLSRLHRRHLSPLLIRILDPPPQPNHNNNHNHNHNHPLLSRSYHHLRPISDRRLLNPPFSLQRPVTPDSPPSTIISNDVNYRYSIHRSKLNFTLFTLILHTISFVFSFVKLKQHIVAVLQVLSLDLKKLRR